MLQIGKTLVSLDVIEQKFACDIERCAGACCIEGDAGAPLEESELRLLKKYFPKIKKYLPAGHLQIIEQKGLYERDKDGDWVTTCHPSGACVFVFYDQRGIAKCAFQHAYEKGEIDWPKPLSCHLYPIRIARYPEFTAVNYSKRDICLPGRIKGEKLGIRVYQFLEKPLRRAFGDQWYEQLDFAAKQWIKQKENL